MLSRSLAGRAIPFRYCPAALDRREPDIMLLPQCQNLRRNRCIR